MTSMSAAAAPRDAYVSRRRPLQQRHQEKETEEKMLEKSAEELAALLDAMQPAGGDEDWKRRTETLVRTIADEIKRMVAFSGEDANLSDDDIDESIEQKNEGKSEQSARCGYHLDGKSGAERAEPEEESVLSFLSSCSDLLGRHERREEVLSSAGSRAKRPGSSDGGRKKDTKLTPYEIWKAARWRQEEPAPVKELTPKQVEELSQRLYAHQIKRELSRRRAQDEALVEEMASLDFKPKINKRSRKLARVKPIQDRLYQIIEQREKRLALERTRLEQEEVADCTGAPQINRTKRWKPKISRRYIDAALQEAQAPCSELTFAPMMNVRSLQMAERASVEGRRQPIEEASPKRSAKAAAAAPPEPPFHPQINPRSRQIVREGQVHERLYQQSTASQSARPPTDLRLDVDPECGNAGSGPAARSPRRGGETEIPYDAARHAFIVARLRGMGADVRLPRQ